MWRTVKHFLGKRKSQCVDNVYLSPSKFNQHFATIGAKLGTKFNDSDSLSWNLPESLHEFRFVNVDVEFVAKQLSLCSARPNIECTWF